MVSSAEQKRLRDMFFKGLLEDDAELRKRAIKSGFEINKSKKSGKKVRDLPQAYRSVEIFEELLGYGMTVIAPRKNSVSSPILLTTSSSLFEHLLNQGYDKQTHDGNGNTALHYAVKRKDLNFIRFLLKQGLDLEARNKEKATPFFSASQRGKGVARILTLLKKAGSEVDARGEIGMTPLLYACRYPDRRPMLKTLVSLGADINATVSEGGGYHEGHSTLHIAAFSGTADMVEFLIEQGMDVNLECGPNKLTPLFEAARMARVEDALEKIQCLVRNGARIDDYEGYLLHNAALKGQAEIFEWLVENGADPRLQQSGGTVLHSAASGTAYGEEGRLRIVVRALELGVDPSLPNQDGKTALDLAREADWERLIPALGGTVDDSNPGRWTEFPLRLHAWEEDRSKDRPKECDLTDLHPGLKAVGPAQLIMPTGYLKVGDPYDLSSFRYFEDFGPPPCCRDAIAYAVTVTSDEVGGTRVALLILFMRGIWAGENLFRPSRWEPAVFDGGDETFGVDRACAGYIDARTLADASEDPRFPKKLEKAFEWGDLLTLHYKRKTVIGCSTGMGDGSYRSWLLKDKNERAVCVVTDFEVLDRLEGWSAAPDSDAPKPGT